MVNNSQNSDNDTFSKDWEDAFFQQYHAASVGQMFQGILHNLNGVNQAFSLQASLLKSTFKMADQLIEKMKQSEGEERLGYVNELQDTLKKRSIMAEQMQSKLDESQGIIKRVLPLAQLYEIVSSERVSVNRIIKYEIDILASISFFKHKVQTHCFFDDSLPLLSHSFEKIHNVIYVIILNAIEASLTIEAPELRIHTEREDNNISIRIINLTDSPWEMDSQIFRPFFSSKEGHLGLGLYLADKIITKLGGSIQVSQEPKNTCFKILLPIQE